MSNRSSKTSSEYRFDVGQQVLCRTGAEEWSVGEIVQLNYSEPGWKKVVPYQVQLEDGGLIFVPADAEKLCRKLTPPWWSAFFAGKPESYFFNNPSADAICKELESSGRNVNEEDHKGQVALMVAAQYNWRACVTELLRLKADVNMVTTSKKHALHFAAPHGEGLTKILIDAKADMNCQEDDPDFDPEFKSVTLDDRKEHRSPLHLAVLMGDATLASLLLSRGAKIDLPDAQYKTALHLAIEEKNSEMIDLLLLRKADVNLGNTESGMKNSPLLEAAHKQEFQLVKNLLAAKAVVNQQGKQSMSALHLAARKGNAEIVQALLESGADVNQTSECGTVEQLARKNGGSAILKVLGLSDADGYSQNVKHMDAAQRAALFLD